MRRRYLLPLLVILMFLFPLLQAENSPAKGLDGRQQSMVLVSAYTARGDLDRLRPALDQALDAGLSINEIKEVLTHLYAYIGFPRSLNGLQVFMEVLEQRRARGITTPKERPPLPCRLTWTGRHTAPVSGPTLADKRRSSPRPASWPLPRSSIPF